MLNSPHPVICRMCTTRWYLTNIDWVKILRSMIFLLASHSHISWCLFTTLARDLRQLRGLSHALWQLLPWWSHWTAPGANSEEALTGYQDLREGEWARVEIRGGEDGDKEVGVITRVKRAIRDTRNGWRVRWAAVVLHVCPFKLLACSTVIGRHLARRCMPPWPSPKLSLILICAPTQYWSSVSACAVTTHTSVLFSRGHYVEINNCFLKAVSHLGINPRIHPVTSATTYTYTTPLLSPPITHSTPSLTPPITHSTLPPATACFHSSATRTRRRRRCCGREWGRSCSLRRGGMVRVRGWKWELGVRVGDCLLRRGMDRALPTANPGPLLQYQCLSADPHPTPQCPVDSVGGAPEREGHAVVGLGHCAGHPSITRELSSVISPHRDAVADLRKRMWCWWQVKGQALRPQSSPGRGLLRGGSQIQSLGLRLQLARLKRVENTRRSDIFSLNRHWSSST